jgi:NAD(P)-dependent dehydrogenase (short-subunit alcohol dehydrogenase family)
MRQHGRVAQVVFDLGVMIISRFVFARDSTRIANPSPEEMGHTTWIRAEVRFKIITSGARCMSFDDKVAVVTGAAKGIGRSVAEAFFREGASVALLDIDAAGAAIAEVFGDRGLFVECDVASGEAVEAAFAAIIQRFGGVDLLVNNAGIQPYGSITETTEDEWNRTLGVNLTSAYLCARQAIPSMLERGGGVVINMASVQSFLSQSRVAAYTTTKTALLGLTRSIAVDYAPKVRCVAVCPGTVDTPLLQWGIRQSPNPEEVLQECNRMHLTGRVAKPEEIADLVLYLCSDKAAFITGQPVRIDGGLGVTIPGSQRQ